MRDFSSRAIHQWKPGHYRYGEALMGGMVEVFDIDSIRCIYNVEENESAEFKKWVQSVFIDEISSVNEIELTGEYPSYHIEYVNEDSFKD